MKRFTLAVFIAMLFTFSASQCFACSCGPYGMEQAFDESSAVFVGEVTEITKPRTDEPKALLTDRLYHVRFKVERTWKGLGFQEITVPEVDVDGGGIGRRGVGRDDCLAAQAHGRVRIVAQCWRLRLH